MPVQDGHAHTRRRQGPGDRHRHQKTATRDTNEPEQHGREKRGGGVVMVSMSLQRVIDRCSFLERELKQLYRRAKREQKRRA